MSGAPRRHTLASGLPVYGVSGSAAGREEFFIDEYFQSGLEFAPGMTVLDIGANIGLFSLEVLRRCAGKARIVACEPAPQSYGFLQRNVRELFPYSSAACLSCAVGAEPGRATLYFKPRFSQLSSLHAEPLVDTQTSIDAALKDPPPNFPQSPSRLRPLLRPLAPTALRLASWWIARKVEEISVEVKTISQILRECEVDRVDVLKVDVEGAELDVLRGIDPGDWPRIQAVTAEVHDIDGRVETIRGMLESAGFERAEFTQQWPFEGTNMYMLEATRPGERRDAPRETSATAS